MKRHRVILDTNVIVADLRSQSGASHRLLMTIGHPQCQSVVTLALMYEHEAVVRRLGQVAGLSDGDLTAILDLLYQRSHRQLVYFSWRPLSHDPGDDLVIEAAVAGTCDFIESFNERHLRPARDFSIEILKPVELLRRIGEIK